MLFPFLPSEVVVPGAAAILITDATSFLVFILAAAVGGTVGAFVPFYVFHATRASGAGWIEDCITDRVLRNTTVPVLVVSSGDPVSTDDRTYDRILASMDGSETAERAAPYSTDIAQHHDAILPVLNVIDPRFEGIFSAGVGSEEFFERLEERGHDFINQFIERGGQTAEETSKDVDIRKTIVRGTTYEEIDEYAVENDIDLVVMASQGESGLTRQLLGSVADRTLRESEKPVLIIPPTG